VPVDVTPINTLYVFVDIGIDTQHFIDTVKRNFEPGKKLVVVGTIQFVTALQVSIHLITSRRENVSNKSGLTNLSIGRTRNLGAGLCSTSTTGKAIITW
jgi:diphthamide biosynthesis enzyme Dph1/Dph2-like protein